MTRFKLLFIGFLLGVSALAGCQKVTDFFGSMNPTHQTPAPVVAPVTTPTVEPSPAAGPVVQGPTTQLETMGAVKFDAAVKAKAEAPKKVAGMSDADKAALKKAYANAARANSLLGEHCYATSPKDKEPHVCS